MRLHKCPNCPAMLNRYQKRSHAKYTCPATRVVLGTRPCSNSKGACTTIIHLKHSNPHQEFCSKKCWNQMRDAPRKTRDRVQPMAVLNAEREEFHMRPLRDEAAFLRAECERTAREMLDSQRRSFALWADLLGLKEAA